MMTETIERLPFWGKLSDDEKTFLGQHASVHSYAKGVFLKGCGEICPGMLYILRGGIRTLMISDEGREITLFHLNRGDCCILSASCVLAQVTFETQLMTTEATEILVVDSAAYSELMQRNIEVRCFTYELATERSSCVIWVLQQILFAGFDRRLAKYLLDTAAQHGKPEITMSKEAIAREVNTAREVVSRMLKRFAEDGLIAMNQKTITLLQPNGLKALL